MPEPLLVIFDCDGVLVDTERPANDYMADVLTRRGLTISGSQCRQRFVGLSLESVHAKILDEDGLDVGVDFAEEIYAGLPELFARGVEAIPGIESAIADLKNDGIPWCVASSGRKEKMHMTLGASGLLQHFEDVLHSATQVERGKPHPDLFLFAAKNMGFLPENCVVVEDSANGVMAGVAAGMRVLAYAGDPESSPDQLAALGGEPFIDMAKLITFLK